ncbi:TIGR03745 family integrating conjugative element membrane protein [Pseudomonas sp. NCHU5208]|uniref:TIGR03745 family integrating conjugative element membrane protein n=1 Tax=unclassified Pseudomonas TaxID=196821 RepID=UPI003F9C7DA4
MPKVQILWLRLIASITALLASPAFAALPRPDAPSRGTEGGFLKMLQNYGYDLLVVAGLAVAAFCFINVAINAVQKFHEVTQKKATWTDFFTVVLVGGGLLIIVIWLVNKATEIL